MNGTYTVRESGGRLIYKDELENVEAVIPSCAEYAGMVEAEEAEGREAEELIAEALAQPLGAPRLQELARGKKRVCILVSDATRAVSTPQVLPHLVEELLRAGVSYAQMVMIVAVGVHREATPAEIEAVAGRYHGLIEARNHRPYEKKELVYLGEVGSGTPVWVNRTAYECDLRIAVGKVEPHEFAGFSGGRKSVLPGICGEETILRNHRPEMILHPNALPGVLQGNPVHQEMREAAKLLGVHFCVNLVQDAQGRPVEAFAGEMEASHAAAVAFLTGRYGAAPGGAADVYLTTPGSPLNIDLYQSIKPLIALTPLFKKGDVAVLYSRCGEGVNSPDMLVPFRQAGDVSGVLGWLSANYRIQMDHALLLCKLYEKGVRVVACSPGVAREDFELLRMLPAGGLTEALERACALSGKGRPRLMICPMPQRLVFGPGPSGLGGVAGEGASG